jgi:hypothetical protein
MRSNQLSYLAIALKASAKVCIIFVFANFFATFLQYFQEKAYLTPFSRQIGLSFTLFWL